MHVGWLDNVLNSLGQVGTNTFIPTYREWDDIWYAFSSSVSDST